MLLTTGDVFFGLITGGLVVAFVGLGMATGSERPEPRSVSTGVALFVVGLLTLIAPAFGAVGAISQWLL